MKPGTARAFSRGAAGRSGRSIRKNAHIGSVLVWALIIGAAFAIHACEPMGF